jgi:RNA polymerase sigma factor (sigma-70 family)
LGATVWVGGGLVGVMMNVRADGGVAIEPVVDLAVLYRQELPSLIRLAAFLLADPRQAEDVCQDVAATLLQKPMIGVDNPAAYLRTAVIHRCRRLQKRSTSRSLAERRYFGRRSALAEDDDALHNDAFFVRLRQLTTAQRTVVVLAYYEDLTLAAVAEQMDMPLGTVKSHLTRALDKLRTTAP